MLARPLHSFGITDAITINSTHGADMVRQINSTSCFKVTYVSCTHTLAVFAERDAFGCDEYHPVTKSGKNLTTDRGIGYMIVDALDTMIIMGEPLKEEYRRARNWVATELDFDRDGRYSTFEVAVIFKHCPLSPFTKMHI